MKLKPVKLYSKLHFASIYTLLVLFICLSFFLTYGKINSFLIINQLHHPLTDVFFKYFTNLGDGLLWVFILIGTYFISKKKMWIVVTNFIISTVLAQGLKRLVFYDELRPSALINNGFDLHFVEGVKMYIQHSFPSGHSTTAFAIAFTIILFLKKKNKIKYFVIAVAFITAYSRVYLAQHYVIDVIVGALLGISSTFISIYILSLFKVSKHSIIDEQLELEVKASILAD
jgi:membrane-associated phospholipid phosphatase